MSNRNTKTNNLIRDLVIAGDFLLLTVVFVLFYELGDGRFSAGGNSPYLLGFLAAVALAIAEYCFPTVIHQRSLSSERILGQVTLLVILQYVLSYVITKVLFLIVGKSTPLVSFTLTFTLIYYPVLLVARFSERWAIKHYRSLGGNSRTVLLVGSDSSLLPVYDFLVSDPTTGYRVIGYYANHAWDEVSGERREASLPPHLGTLADLEAITSSSSSSSFLPFSVGRSSAAASSPASSSSLPFSVGRSSAATTAPIIPDELYCSLSWSKRDAIQRIMRFCDRHVIHFYFIPVRAESFGHSLKIEQIGETVGYTNYVDPLQLPTNKLIKRLFDIIFSLFVLLLLLPFAPVIALIIKLQSPGPVFFRQQRTGIGGQSFQCLKFRSMHVNVDADRLQATKDDPRKFPFGNLMRRMNIDELPQFWNVLRGDMSIVGPRPHMLAHTEQYSQLIDKYMVRHFVRPGITGWAQVTGYRGETQELWQMEGRIKRDIWYIENWSFWLDLRIIWRTLRQLIIPDKNAY